MRAAGDGQAEQKLCYTLAREGPAVVAWVAKTSASPAERCLDAKILRRVLVPVAGWAGMVSPG